MALEQPLWLLLAAPLFIVAIAAARARPRGSAGLRVFMLLALLVALARPQWHARTNATTVAFVLDHPESTLAHARVRQLAQALPSSTTIHLVALDADPPADPPTVQPLASASTRATSSPARAPLRDGLARALGLIPANETGSVVIVSDGRSPDPPPDLVARARARGIKLHTVVLPCLAPQIHFDSLPSRTSPGEMITGSLRLEGGRAGLRGTLQVLLADKLVLEQSVRVPAKTATYVAVEARAPDGGVHDSYSLRARVVDDSNAGKPIAEANTQLFVDAAMRVRIVDPDGRSAIADVLRNAGMEVEVVPPERPGSAEQLATLDLLVLANASAAHDATPHAMPHAWLAAVANYVDRGGGLLVLGGPQSFDMGGYGRTALKRVLPVELDPRNPEVDQSVSLVLALDRSGSMAALADAGRSKMELADEGAAAALELLRPFDRAGVLSATETVRWELRPQTVRNADEIRRKVMRVRANGGGIFVFTALKAAYDALDSTNTRHKHVVLFSDAADSEEKVEGVPFGTGRGNTAEQLAARARRAGVTTSVIALGKPGDPDTAFLRQLARAGGGRFSLTEDPTTLRALFVQETEQVVKTSVSRNAVHPQRLHPHPIVAGIEYDSGPQLDGYQRLRSRPPADVVLGAPNGDPLLVAWRYGLGHVVVWAADAGTRWSRSLLPWTGFARQWTQAARYAARVAPDSTALEVTMESGYAQVTVAHTGVPIVLKSKPEQASQWRTHNLHSIEPGLWSARLSVRPGSLYTLEIRANDGRVLATRKFAATTPRNRLALGSNLGERTAGRGRPAASLEATATNARTHLRYGWPWALLVAVCLLPIDVWLRRRERVWTDD